MSFEEIPQELLIHIFEYLPKSNSFNIVINHSNLSLVCKKFNRAISHELFWTTPIRKLEDSATISKSKSFFIKKSKKLGKSKQLSKCELNFMFFGSCCALTNQFLCEILGLKMIASPNFIHGMQEKYQTTFKKNGTTYNVNLWDSPKNFDNSHLYLLHFHCEKRKNFEILKEKV
jgi:hypothetical protein